MLTRSLAGEAGATTIHLFSYSNDPKEVVEEIRDGAVEAARAHAGEKGLTDEIIAVVALTPMVAAKRDELARGLDDVVATVGKRCSDEALGPRDGGPFRLSYRFEEDKPVVF